MGLCDTHLVMFGGSGFVHMALRWNLLSSVTSFYMLRGIGLDFSMRRTSSQDGLYLHLVVGRCLCGMHCLLLYISHCRIWTAMSMRQQSSASSSSHFLMSCDWELGTYCSAPIRLIQGQSLVLHARVIEFPGPCGSFTSVQLVSKLCFLHLQEV